VRHAVDGKAEHGEVPCCYCSGLANSVTPTGYPAGVGCKDKMCGKAEGEQISR